MEKIVGGSGSGVWIVETVVRFEFAFPLEPVVCLLNVSVGVVEFKSEGSEKHEVEGVLDR